MAPRPNIRDNLDEHDNLIQEENAVKIGKKEVLYDGYFYDVTNFIDKHPGGYVIDYYTNTGEDATVPIMMFHHRSKKKVDAIMSSLPRRPAMEHESKFKNFKIFKHFLHVLTAV